MFLEAPRPRTLYRLMYDPDSEHEHAESRLVVLKEGGASKAFMLTVGEQKACGRVDHHLEHIIRGDTAQLLARHLCLAGVKAGQAVFGNNSSTGYCSDSIFGSQFKAATQENLNVSLAPYDLRYMLAQHLRGCSPDLLESRAHRMGTSGRALRRSYSAEGSREKGWIAAQVDQFSTTAYDPEQQHLLVPDGNGLLVPARVVRESSPLTICALMKVHDDMRYSVGPQSLLYYINKEDTDINGINWTTNLSMALDKGTGGGGLWRCRNMEGARRMFKQSNPGCLLPELAKIGSLCIGYAVSGARSKAACGDVAYDEMKALLVHIMSVDYEKKTARVVEGTRMHQSEISWSRFKVCSKAQEIEASFEALKWPIDVQFDPKTQVFDVHCGCGLDIV